MIYGELIVNSRLYRQFDKLAGYENVTEAEVDTLKGMVTDVANAVQEPMSKIEHTFKQYTKHDLQHLLNIANHIFDFLPGEDVEGEKVLKLNALELAYLWLAILLHDVGMFVSDAEEKQAILDADDYAGHQRHNRGRLDAADEAERAGQTVKAGAIRDAVFAEFIRKRHAHRVHAFIAGNLSERLQFRNAPLSKDVGLLCESHNWGVRQSWNPRKPEECVLRMSLNNPVDATRVNLRYLACCLRLGDILDFDRTRTPISAFHSIHFTESVSVEEWNKHLSIKGITVSEQRVEYHGSCEKPADFVAVQGFLDFVDRELQEATRVVREFPKDIADRYQLNLAPVVDRHEVKMADPRFVVGGFRFQLEYEQIMKLLMDKSLYPDETMFLRELLQNALDACRYQKARAEELKQDHRPVSYVPRIQVFDGSELPHDRENPDKGPRIEFRDNGIGMSLEQVENFFMRVGKSFYRSAEFSAERERLEEKGIHLDACSRFGIGFLSCFLGGDRIVVETFQYGSRPLRITIEGPSKYFVIEELPGADLVNFPAYVSPHDLAQDSPPDCSGTKVTVFLRENWRVGSTGETEDLVYRVLDKYAVNQEIPIFTSTPNKKVLEIESRRWDVASPTLAVKRRKWIVPVTLDFSEYDDRLRGRGAIWFLRDDSGAPSVRQGLIKHKSSSFGEFGFVTVARRLIRDGLRHQGLVAIETYLNQPDDSSPLIPLRLSNASVSQLEWVMQVLRSDITVEDLAADEQELQALWEGNLDKLAFMWRRNGMRSESRRLSVPADYRLALFGIESHGGFQLWNIEKGSVLRESWLPAGNTANIDSYGSIAPEPAASRIFVPAERGKELRGRVSVAFIQKGLSLASKNSSSADWMAWFRAHLMNWARTTRGHRTRYMYSLPPDEIRSLMKEIEGTKGVADILADQDFVSGLWCEVAYGKSLFGNKLAQSLDLGVSGTPSHIDWTKVLQAGKDSYVAQSRVDAEFQSFCEYMGWDAKDLVVK